MLTRTWALGVLLLVGCTGSRGGHEWFSKTGFDSVHGGYGFHALPSGQLLGPGWSLQNFQWVDGHWAIKAKGHFVHKTRWVMASGSERPATIVTNDLLYSHTASNGVIWVQRIPLPRAARDKSIHVLAENFATGIAGSLYEARLDGRVEQRRVATRLTRSQPIPARGHLVEFEIVDLDQLELDPNAPRRKARVVLFDRFHKRIRLDSDGRHLLGQDGGVVKLPAVLAVGYANDLSTFDTHAADFDDLARRLWIKP